MSLGSPIITTVVGPLIETESERFYYTSMTVSAERVIITPNFVTGNRSYAMGQRRRSVNSGIATVNADTLGAWVSLVDWAAEYVGRKEHKSLVVTGEADRQKYQPETRTVWERHKSA